MRRTAAAGLALVALLVTAAGCGRPPLTHYYLLEPQDAGRARAGGGVTIAVAPFLVDAPYDQERIVYRAGREALEVGFYEYHRWAAPLSRMLADLVTESLRGVEGIGRVELLGAAGPAPGFVLDGRLAVLEELDTAEGELVRFALELRLRDGTGVELWSERLSGEAPVGVERPAVEDVARAMSRLLVEAIRGTRLPLAER